MTTFWRKKQFWGALIGLILLVYCVKDLKWEELTYLAGRVNLLYLAAAALSGFVYMFVKGMRWRLMVSQQKKIGVQRAVTLYSVGQLLGIIMPVLTGQVGRVMLFSRKEGLRKTVVFSTIVLEVLFDAVSLIIFMFITSLAFAFPSEYRYMSFVVAAITVVAMILLYLILHYRDGLENISQKRLRHRWPGAYITIKKFIRSFAKGIEMLKSSQHMFGTLFLSLASWTSHMLMIWFLTLGFGFELPFAAAAVIMIINTIVLMVPITPGNAGTFEVAVSGSLAAFSIGRSDAVLFALVLHLLDFLPVVIFGYFFLHVEKLTISEIKAGHEDDIILDRITEEGSFIEGEKV